MSKVLRGTNTNIRLEVMVEHGNEADSQAEKERVLGSLLKTKHFAEARRFAELMGLVDDHITIKQVRRLQKHDRTKNAKRPSFSFFSLFFFFFL